VVSGGSLSAQNGVARCCRHRTWRPTGFRRETLALARRLRPLWDATLEDIPGTRAQRVRNHAQLPALVA
jgi:hypothetical protein